MKQHSPRRMLTALIIATACTHTPPVHTTLSLETSTVGLVATAAGSFCMGGGSMCILAAHAIEKRVDQEYELGNIGDNTKSSFDALVSLLEGSGKLFAFGAIASSATLAYIAANQGSTQQE